MSLDLAHAHSRVRANGGLDMKVQRWQSGLLVASVVVGSGCVRERHRHHVVFDSDHEAPAEPRDVYSVTGDGEVILYWSPPWSPDVAGYRIFISEDDLDYYAMAEVASARRHFVVSGSALPARVPFEFVNGNTYFLGVSAFDGAGNASSLTSGSTTFDTPRPSGRSLVLYDRLGPRGGESGYDFSRSPYGYAMDGGSLFADIYFTVSGGRAWIRSAHPEVVELQDRGFLDFDDPECGYLAESSWIPSSDVEARRGHVYLVKIFEETRPGNATEPFHVAKFRVTDVNAQSVWIDWAYQISPNNRELKPPPVGTTTAGRLHREVQG